MNNTLSLPARARLGRGASSTIGLLGAITGLGLIWVWSSPAFRVMWASWVSDPHYSHGFFVPAYSGFLLWHRRKLIETIQPGGFWAGTALIVVGLLLDLAGIYFYYEWFSMIALLPALAGLFVLVGGWPALRWSWPAIFFLAFMIPLPYRVEYALGQPLQFLATRMSAFALQTLGLPAVVEGNVIAVGDARIGVVEACNGLGMLVMFAAFSVGMVFLIERPWTDKSLILLGAVPTALLANIIRITVTGVLHAKVSGETANAVFHDWAGYLMMPLALGMLWLELVVLDHLFVAAPASAPVKAPSMDWAFRPTNVVDVPARPHGRQRPRRGHGRS